MEIAVGISIGMIVALVIGRGKKRREVKPSSNFVNAQTERKHIKQADEELITVILPTINNDK